MITEAIINFFIELLASILHIIPLLDFDVSGFTAIVGELKNIIQQSAYFLPIADIAIVVSLILSYQTVALLIWGANWVIRRIADVIP